MAVLKSTLIITMLLLAALASTEAYADKITLLNVSYDPTREFYEAYNQLFTKYWKDKTDQDVKIKQSHGGSGKQARAVIDGLRADVVTLALAYDIDEIARHTHLLPENWQSKLPNNSTPYNSIIVFVVRKGNPKHIKDWDDLIRDDIQVLTPNPKTSGGARWNYLAAWGYAYKKNNADDDAAKAYMQKLFAHTPILETGARGATTDFIKRNIGDVLITWESEALLIVHDIGKDQFEVVTPTLSILAEPPVAVIEKNAESDGTEKAAQAYLEHLYSKEAQELAAKSYYRPTDKEIMVKYSNIFPATVLTTIKDFGGWEAAQKKHFADGGIFDQIYTSK